MAQIEQALRRPLFGLGPKWHAWCAMALDCLGTVCLVIGIVASAIGSNVGLGATNWVLIAIALWVWGLWSWLAAYFAAKEG